MPIFETCAKLAAYLICIGLALEISHRLYWHVNERISDMDLATTSRAVLNTLVACVPMASAIAITALFVGIFDSQSISELGLSYNGESLTKVAFGAGIALGCVTLVFLMGVLMGFIEVKRSKMSEDCVACIPVFLGGMMDFFTAGVFEEIVFRGYVFFILQKSFGVEIAIAASSIVFALSHLIKHTNTPVMYVLNCFIFGLLAAYCRSYTGTLWLPIGLHFGWNVVSGPIFGLPYSGRTYDRGVVVSDVTGPTWLTGGRYSLDAGILGTLALAIAAVGLSAVAPLH